MIELAEEIVIFGIEPVTIEPKMSLTPTLEGKLNEYLSVLQKEIIS